MRAFLLLLSLLLPALAACAPPSSAAFYKSLPAIPPSSVPTSPILIKYGGNAMTSPHLSDLFCQDIAYLRALNVPLIIVHGGGPMISSLLKELSIESKFDDKTGVRISSPAVVRAAAFALNAVNKDLSHRISTDEISGVGLDGRDGRLLRCERAEGGRIGDVGVVTSVNTAFLGNLIKAAVPIISPIGCSVDPADGTVFNINADVAAGTIAEAMKCSSTIFLTDISGVLDGERKLLPKLTKNDVEALISSDVITGGMIPKVQYALRAASYKGSKAVIADGRVEHAVVKEVFKLCGIKVGEGEEAGTTITCD
jgi:acetylglutamate kinase